jgi:antagonist of KipI
MPDVTLTIRTPGLLTTVQDAGRWGHQHEGVPVAGPMDPFALRGANLMAGNPPDAACLEITLTGPAFVASGACTIAIAGATFDVAVDGRKVETDRPIALGAGAEVRFGRRIRGARTYLAVGGGIDVPLVLGSRATHVMTRMGGFDGRPLRPGDVLHVGRTFWSGNERSAGRTFRSGAPGGPDGPPSGQRSTVRILPGPQADRFVGGMLDRLQSAAYVVAQDSDRTGYRLRGPALAHARGADIISDATPHGSIQVPASGQPILLMAGRQTTGGYPKIATVIAADLGVAGQLAPGDEIQFRVCSRQDALTALIARERALLAIDAREART